jgi:hypothetical protein
MRDRMKVTESTLTACQNDAPLNQAKKLETTNNYAYFAINKQRSQWCLLQSIVSP